MSNRTGTLHIQGLEFDLHLGYGEEERSKTQTVTFDMDLIFSILPTACESDSLEGGICYDTLVKGLYEHLRQQEWHTMEFLVAGAGTYLNEYYHELNDWKIRVYKKNPPIPFACQSAGFSLSKGGLE
jgi:FolB domain-containing protein